MGPNYLWAADLTLGLMDLVKIGHSYVNRMVGSGSGAGSTPASSRLRVLLLDSDTTAIVSMFATQSQLLKHDIYLIDRLDNDNRDKMRHLKCVVFVRPTEQAVQAICSELADPRYGAYELYWSNAVSKSQLERVAQADRLELVSKVAEAFADFLVINPDLFSLGLSHNFSQFDVWLDPALRRTVSGIVGALLSTKMRPLIRYDSNSKVCRRLAAEVAFQLADTLAIGNTTLPVVDTPPVLLLVDRRNDPVTPLLTPWTYQAMVHELIGIHNNRVDLSGAPGVPADQREVVLSPGDHDAFFSSTMYLNFGDLGAQTKDYVSQYAAKSRSSQAIESVQDMKRFVEDYPELRKLSGNVSKHVALVSELSRLVDAHQLLAVSELEQSLACNDRRKTDLNETLAQFHHPQVTWDAKVRLAALYALRYEDSSSLQQVLEPLQSLEGAIQSDLDAVRLLVETYAGSHQRHQPLYGSSSIFARAQSGLKGLKGVENVYTQHEPLLKTTLQQLIRGRLRKQTHPYHDDGRLPAWAKANATDESADKPHTIMAFMVGGTTFEEARVVAEMNNQARGSVRIVLGGSTVHNSRSFLRQVEALDGDLR